MNSVDINPNRLIPQAITKLTSITDDMVKGQQINENEVASFLSKGCRHNHCSQCSV